MIRVEAATAAALAQDAVRVRPRVQWALQGGLLDITDRLIAGSLPRVRHEIGAYLSGERYPAIFFELQNEDNLLTPDTVSGSLLANKTPDQWMLDTITYDVGVQRADDTWEYIPVFTGLVSDPVLEPGKLTITVTPLMTYASQTELPWEYTFRPTDGLNTVSYFFGANTTITYPAYFHESFTAGLALLPSLDWSLFGTVRRGTTIGAAALLIAKSCMGTLWTTEDGKVAFASEFPGVAGDYGYFPWEFPETIRERDCSDWRMSRPLDLAAREVTVQYQGVSVSWRATSQESNIGRLPRTVTAPYMAFMRQALLAARVLFEQYGEYPIVLSFTMGIRGLLLQLNDRVKIENPFNPSSVLRYRIVSKDVASPMLIRFEAVLEGHQATVVRNTTFAKWGTTTWDAVGAEFL